MSYESLYGWIFDEEKKKVQINGADGTLGTAAATVDGD
jgi:hypothetical protein